ncbi:MAG: type and secretion system protein [Firmicutes bacterium]|nr:type and secretion system protein [Bacillota bacterium]
MKGQYTIIIALALLLFMLAPAPPAAAAGDYVVTVNQSLLLSFNGMQRVAVSNPDIADVAIVSGSELLLVGRSPGSTTLYVWTAQEQVGFSVKVAAEERRIANEIKKITGCSELSVGKVNETVVLEGRVNDQFERSRVEKAAGAYGEKVINLMELRNPTQVKIEARIIEIDKNKTNSLGVLWGNTPSAPGSFSFGQSYTAANSVPGQNQAFGWFGSYSDVNAELDALVQTGDAKILFCPYAVVLSGEKANLSVGGEIPVPVSVNNGQVGIEWKTYGVKLAIEPTVNSENLIQSKITAESSSLDWDSAHRITLGSGMSIPPLIMRKTEAVVALESGKTIVFGGLIAEQAGNEIYKLPLLGDLPIVGPVFRSKSSTRTQTEFLVLVTPTVIDTTTYQPLVTGKMQALLNENPWQEGKKNEERRDKSSGR